MAARLAWLRAIREPERAAAWSLAEWDRVIRLATRQRLLGRLACSIDRAGLLGRVPLQARRHLIAAQKLSEYRTRAMTWAIEAVGDALGGAGYPLVLLKGAAYVAQDLDIARGRMPSDLDIMVPKASLADAQGRLSAAGWREVPLDDYDRRYYLEWSHELPPMTHPQHAIELDVHHNILPPRKGQMVDVDRLFERLVPSPWEPWQVLGPQDQILHSAAHLSLDPELQDRMRDLVDLDGLLRQYQTGQATWVDLSARASSLELDGPVALAMSLCSTWIGSTAAGSAMEALPRASTRSLSHSWLYALMRAAMLPAEPNADADAGKRLALYWLKTRYQLNRLPLSRLVPHLWHKLAYGRPWTAATGN